ncbi:MAG TPA: hypothetical protein PK950_01600 [Candidatus Paceibacterota bacterium]|nr:hypothetical protein [Candidatus Paceibacterota bacterium]
MTGFNPIGAGAAGEPLYVITSPFPWSYRLEWIQNLLKISFAVLALLFGLVIIVIYFALKNQIAFSSLGMYVLLAVIIAALIFAWQKALRNKIKERLAEFNNEIDAYVLSHSISRSDIALPLGYNYGNGLLRRSFMYALIAAVVWPLLFILAIQV